MQQRHTFINMAVIFILPNKFRLTGTFAKKSSISGPTVNNMLDWSDDNTYATKKKLLKKNVHVNHCLIYLAIMKCRLAVVKYPNSCLLL